MEYVDIYDRDRRPTGIVRLKNSPLAEGEYIAIAHLIIFNHDGDMLIQQRQHNKTQWPGRWDLSAGGGAMAGETPTQTAQRETLEELGVNLSLEGMRPILTVHYPLGFDDYFLITADIPLEQIRCQDEEVIAVKWASKAEILRMQEQGEFVTYKDGFLEFLFALREGRGTYDESNIR